MVLVTVPVLVSDGGVVWSKTFHKGSMTAGILLWALRNYSDRDPKSSKAKKKVR